MTTQERLLDLEERRLEGRHLLDPVKEMRALKAVLPTNHGLTDRELRAIVDWKVRDKLGMDDLEEAVAAASAKADAAPFTRRPSAPRM